MHVVLLLTLPSVVVAAGPLVGNGSPAKIAAYAMTGMVLLNFMVPKARSSAVTTVNLGVITIGAYATTQIVILADTDTDALGPLQQAAITRTILNIVATCGVAVYLLTGAKVSQSRNFVLGAFLVATTYAAVVGLLQGVSTVDMRYLLMPPGFVITTEKVLAIRDGFTRVVGTSDHPIEFAVLVACALPIAVHFSRFGVGRLARRLSTVSVVVLLLAIPASVSRTAIAALVASILVYIFALQVKYLITGLVGLATTVALYYVVAPDLFSAVVKLFTGANEDTSISSRTDDYAYVSDMFRQKPWIGHGFASTIPGQTRYLDNQWLQVIIQGGIVGLLGLALLSGSGLIAITLALRKTVGKAERDLVFALSAAYVALLASTSFFDMFAFQQARFVFFIILALLWSMAYPVRGLKTAPVQAMIGGRDFA